MDFVPDIPRLYTAAAEWLSCMVYVLTLKKRFKPAAEWLIAFGFLGLFCAVQTVAGMLPLYLWIPGMAVAMLTTYFCVFSLCKIRAFDAIYWAARIFVLAEFMASFEWQIYYYFTHNMVHVSSRVFEIFFLAFIYSAIAVAAYLLERRYVKNVKRFSFAPKDLFLAFATAIMIFAVSNISFISKNTPFSGTQASEIYYIRTLVDFCGVVLFYGQQEQHLWLHAKHELDATQSVLERQYEQYIFSKENIERLDRTYHDLKHKLACIRNEDNAAQKDKYLEQMERDIRFYEMQNKTGNKVLDTLLAHKSMVCLENGINFTVVADGTLLDFLDVMDLCSIAGNALDNAIESVSKLEDSEKRIVKMAVYSKDNFVMLRFENYMEDKPTFENGLPVTTKKNKEFHGYGIKSIKAAAEKHGGSMEIAAADNWFCLRLLIPVAETESN